MNMRRIRVVIRHAQKRFQNFRVRKRVLDEAKRRLFVQRKILLQKPVDAVALHIGVGAYDNSVVVRRAPTDFGDGILLSLIGDRFDLPRIWNHRIKDGFPVFVLPFLVIRRHEICTDMTGKGCEINLPNPFCHFVFMIFVTSLHIAHKAWFFRNK